MRIYKRFVLIMLFVLLISSTVVYAESSSFFMDFSQFDDMVIEEFGGKYKTMNVADIPWTKNALEELYGSEIENWVGDQIATWDGENDTAYFYINKNIGRDGAGMRMLSTPGTNTELYFVKETLEDGKVSIFSYDFKVIRRNSSVANYFRIAGGWKNVSYVNTQDEPDYITNQSDTTQKAPFSEGEWYTVVVIVDGYQANSYLFNAQGEQLLTASKTYDSSTEKTGAQIARLDGYVDGGTEIYLDNIEKHVYYPAEAGPSVTVSGVDNGEQEIPRNPTFEFTFDQEISGSVAIKDKDGIDVANVRTDKIAYNKVKVSVEGLLERNEEYTISFAGIKNDENLFCGSEEIAFKTEDIHIWNGIDLGTVEQNGDNVDITFTLSDSLGYTSYTGVMMAAKYENGFMKAVSNISLSDVAVGSAITKSFDLGVLTENSKIKLIQIDLMNGPVVLAIGE